MKIKFHLIFKYFTFLYLIYFSLFSAKNIVSTKANEIDNNINSLNFKNSKNLLTSFYLLGPGDQLFLRFEGLDIFNNKYTINQNGEITLPEIDNVNIEGYTIKELESFLEKKYQNSIENPKIKVSISKYRPVTVFLGGAVNRTGIFTLEYKANNANQFKVNTFQGLNKPFNFSNLNGMVPNSQLPPKLIEAIQLGSGISNNANLSEIQIVRKNSQSQGGGEIKTTINLIKILELGDISQNIDLRDGDYIYIPESKSSTLEQLQMVNKSNFTPDVIKVFVNGNFANPGRITIPQGSSLYETIAASGGRLSLSGKISFLRLQTNDTPQKKIFNYQPNSMKGSKFNPILQENDIILIRKNSLGKATEIISDFSTPILSSYGSY